jgi:hypothetical protein
MRKLSMLLDFREPTCDGGHRCSPLAYLTRAPPTNVMISRPAPHRPVLPRMCVRDSDRQQPNASRNVYCGLLSVRSHAIPGGKLRRGGALRDRSLPFPSKCRRAPRHSAARALRGHAAAAPPSSLSNSRRFIQSPNAASPPKRIAHLRRMMCCGISIQGLCRLGVFWFVPTHAARHIILCR